MMTDSGAMNTLAHWMETIDPELDESLPEWVWDLVTLVDDLLIETGRFEAEEEDDFEYAD